MIMDLVSGFGMVFEDGVMTGGVGAEDRRDELAASGVSGIVGALGGAHSSVVRAGDS